MSKDPHGVPVEEIII
jgi:hypothetical protein